ncbi:MAG TPA: hypothetical protein VK861_01945, partial [Bacteroidales bacterium]|nr:hypothetical protein [Bacteroidales bacterium]
WFTLFAIGAYGSLSWAANPIIYLYFVGMVIVIFLTEGIVAPLFSTEKGIMKNAQSLISVILFVIMTTIIFLLNDRTYVTEINGGMIIAASGVLYLAAKYLNSVNIRALAKDKKHFISDLR